MRIIQSNFYKNPHRINHTLCTNIKNGAISTPASLKADFAKGDAENYKASYMLNFKGGMSYEKSSSSGIGTLNHQTAFSGRLKRIGLFRIIF